MAEENVIYIGQKPTSKYILAVLMQFNNKNANRVVLKARGKAISKAVDVAQIITRRFLKDVKVGSIQIGTDELQDPSGRKINISTIAIELVRR
ncbi:MAG: DNA-binding protein Alba [bacterium]|nr:DNA-binding protein Alba [bacterium]